MLYCGDVPPVFDPQQSGSVSLSIMLPSSESVRALARLLRDSELSEIAVEDTSGEHVRRLVMRRPLLAASPNTALPSGTDATGGSDETEEPLTLVTVGQDGIEVVVTQSQTPPAPPVAVASPVVGIFQPVEPPLEVGAVVKAQQILGYVESMRVPNEVRAPSAGVLHALLCLPGQGIEYGQLLFEITVELQEVAP